jgi:hypothetical protein
LHAWNRIRIVLIIRKKMSTLLIEFNYIHECLSLICEAENELLDSSFRGLFKKKNYIKIHNTLDVSISKLSELSRTLDLYRGSTEAIDAVVNDAQNFIRALLLSTEKLIVMNQSLSQKSIGKSYEMRSYNQDLSEFKFLQEEYSAIGDRMNANYRLYSHEISQAERKEKKSGVIDSLYIEHPDSQIEFEAPPYVMPTIKFEAMRLPENNGSNGFPKLFIPSVALSEVVGVVPISRVEVVSKIWVYVKENNLQSKIDRKKIIADHKLLPIFGKSEVTMFELASLISKHLK